MIRILIADDENLIRNLLVSALTKYDDIEVVGQAANGEEVIEILKLTQPDVLLLDLNMPRISGFEVLNQLFTESIRVNTIVLSMLDRDESVWEAINLGALGFLGKTDDWDELHNAIKTVATGKFYNTDRVHSLLLDMARKQKQATSAPFNQNFSERELSIIRCLQEGLSSVEIAEKIFCSRANVDRIRQELIHRAGVRNTTELVAFAIGHKLVEISNH